jgi:F0F1-type ATP synthase assembly protein I
MENKPERESRSTLSADQDKSRGLKNLGLFAVIVGDLMGYTGAGIGIGYLAWVKLGAPWWVLLVTTLAGLGLAFYRVYQVSQREL